MELVVFRTSGWDTPWWVSPNRDSGRFNPFGTGPVQYWSLHPLGPYAEYVRAQHWTQELREALRLRIWVARLPDYGIQVIGFDDAEAQGLQAHDLISDDLGPCQDFGAVCLERGSPAGLRVPSAALPGTENIVLFGVRVSSPYTLEPLGHVDVPTAIGAEGAVPPSALMALVRRPGTPHAAFESWANGQPFAFEEPVIESQ